jgi:hypothetical protein
VLLICFLYAALSCSSDAVPDCFKNAGAMVTYEVPVSDFMRIAVYEGVEVIITEGSQYTVTVSTGENLKEDISAEVIDGELYLKNSGGCNWVRDYNSTTIYVTAPHLEKIYSASQFAVKSSGVLHYPVLSLQSGLSGNTASGTFELAIDSESLTVEDNQSAYYKISGNVDNLNVSFYSGDARFEGSRLNADKVSVFHRSTNNIIINPQLEVRGTLYSTGNLVLKNTPPVVQVEQLYTGSVVFE